MKVYYVFANLYTEVVGYLITVADIRKSIPKSFTASVR